MIFDYADEQEKIEFELHLALVSTESWVVSPKHLALWNGGAYIVWLCMYCTELLFYREKEINKWTPCIYGMWQ